MAKKSKPLTLEDIEAGKKSAAYQENFGKEQESISPEDLKKMMGGGASPKDQKQADDSIKLQAQLVENMKKLTVALNKATKSMSRVAGTNKNEDEPEEDPNGPHDRLRYRFGTMRGLADTFGVAKRNSGTWIDTALKNREARINGMIPPQPKVDTEKSPTDSGKKSFFAQDTNKNENALEFQKVLTDMKEDMDYLPKIYHELVNMKSLNGKNAGKDKDSSSWFDKIIDFLALKNLFGMGKNMVGKAAGTDAAKLGGKLTKENLKFNEKTGRYHNTDTGKMVKGVDAEKVLKGEKSLGKFGKMATAVAKSPTAKFLGKAAAPIAVGIDAYEGYSDYGDVNQAAKEGKITKDQADVKKAKVVGRTAGKIGGGLAGAGIGATQGAAAGASIGAFFGGVGAVPGAIIGGAVGGIAGWFGGEYVGGKVVGKGAELGAKGYKAVQGKNPNAPKIEAQSYNRTIEHTMHAQGLPGQADYVEGVPPKFMIDDKEISSKEYTRLFNIQDPRQKILAIDKVYNGGGATPTKADKPATKNTDPKKPSVWSKIKSFFGGNKKDAPKVAAKPTKTPKGMAWMDNDPLDDEFDGVDVSEIKNTPKEVAAYKKEMKAKAAKGEIELGINSGGEWGEDEVFDSLLKAKKAQELNAKARKSPSMFGDKVAQRSNDVAIAKEDKKQNQVQVVNAPTTVNNTKNETSAMRPPQRHEDRSIIDYFKSRYA
jgi:hypothetical protein